MEDGDLVLPDRVDRGESPTRVGIVHHVVMNERRRVEDLHQRRPPVGLLLHAPANLRAEKHQNGADPLPLLADEIARHQLDESDVRTERLTEYLRERIKVALNGMCDVLEIHRVPSG